MILRRKLFIAVILAVCISVTIAGIVLWIVDSHPKFNPEISVIDSMLVLLAYASAVLCLLAILKVALVALLRWAVHHQRIRLLQLAHRWAPALTQGVVGTALGTSIVLASSSMAHAAADPPPAPAVSAAFNPATEQGQQSTPNSMTQLPTPRWSAQPLPVQLPRVLGTPQTPRKAPKDVEQEVIVRHGDTLWNIAESQLGRQATIAEISTFWPKIYELNKRAIGPDPDRLELGIVLKIPRLV